MGFQDRDYYREESEYRFGLAMPNTMIVRLIAANVIVFVVNLILGRFIPAYSGTESSPDNLSSWLSVHPATLQSPWVWWQLVTYGFTHVALGHLFWNMVGLFFFGNDVEPRIGRYELLRVYIVSVFLGGLMWALRINLFPFVEEKASIPQMQLLGASGAVSAVVFLSIFADPNRDLNLFGIFRIRAWVLGGIFLLGDLTNAFRATGTAGDVHLAGIAMAFLYVRYRWNFAFLTPSGLFDLPRRILARRPRLKLHDPEKKAQADELEADRILQKIGSEGEASLSKAERKFMEEYSRRVRQRRNR
jgi:membrane associated rhomboid family serine protease